MKKFLSRFFHFHQWSRWVKTEHGEITNYGRHVGYYRLFERTCDICYLTKAKVEKVNILHS